MLDAYVAGVNRGLGDLKAVPFEYLLLRAQPEPWTAEDTVLTGFAMYVSLQEADGLTERRRGAAREVLGQPRSGSFMMCTWREKALDVRGRALDCGHTLQEEAPEETLSELLAFLIIT